MREFKVGDWVTDDCNTGKIEDLTHNCANVNFESFRSIIALSQLILVKPLRIRYLNYKGVQAWREIIPLGTHFKASPYHNEGKPTWIMEAFDLDKEAMRDFCMSDILEIG